MFLTICTFVPENSDIYLTLLRPETVFSLNQGRKSPLLCEDKVLVPFDERLHVIMEEHFEARLGQER